MWNPAETVTASIVAAIENGETGEGWTLPWHKKGFGIPVNAATGKQYHGSNIITFSIVKMAKGYPTDYWATYKQWESLNAQVQKGEKSTLGFYFERKNKTDKSTGEKLDETYMFVKAINVFNASQVSGWTPPESKLPPSNAERIAHAESIVESTHAVINHGFDRACYIPSMDRIHMPELKQFKNTYGYYSTIFHELGHWTGSEKRLNREFGKRFGDEAYAFEELVADLTGAFVCASVGIPSESRPDHAKYIAHWLKVLKQDSKAIWTAASKAEKAMKFILNSEKES